MAANRSYSFGEYTLDLRRGTLLKAGADVRLRPKSFEVLRLLVERHGELVSKEDLLSAVWRHAVVTDGAVGQCLIDVRRAIGDESQHIIRTVPRRGYIFDQPVVESSEDIVRAQGDSIRLSASPQAQGRKFPKHGVLVPALLAALILPAIGWTIWWSVSKREADVVAPPQQSIATAPPNSIAILPFIDLSPEQDQQYFSDGISEEILNLLAQSPGLQVIARTSSFSFKGRNADIAEIAAKLNVAHVLEGSVRKSGSRVRITAQLVDATNSAHLWSETYDRELQDVFAVQSEIAARVSDALKVTFEDERLAPASPTPSAEAHELFLRARFFYNRRAPGDVARAREYYERALRIDPRFARAWAGLAGAYRVQISTGELSAQVGLARQADAIEQALTLDPNLAEAHVRAAEHYYETGHRQRAREHSRKAYALEPDHPLVLAHYAEALSWDGRWDEALQALRRAAILDPVSALNHNALAGHLMAAGRYDEAREERLKELELNPEAKADIDIDLVQILILQHRFAEARELIERWPDGPSRDQGLTLVYRALGQHAESQAALQRLAAGTDAATAVRLAEVYAQWGDVEEAFRWMQTARERFGPKPWLTTQDQWVWMLRMSPFLRPLHGDSRWLAMSKIDPAD